MCCEFEGFVRWAFFFFCGALRTVFTWLLVLSLSIVEGLLIYQVGHKAAE